MPSTYDLIKQALEGRTFRYTPTGEIIKIPDQGLGLVYIELRGNGTITPLRPTDLKSLEEIEPDIKPSQPTSSSQC